MGESQAVASGIGLAGGMLLVEGNTITGNIINSTREAVGGGIGWWRTSLPGVIPEVIIRNNVISDNSLSSNFFKPPSRF